MSADAPMAAALTAATTVLGTAWLVARGLSSRGRERLLRHRAGGEQAPSGSAATSEAPASGAIRARWRARSRARRDDATARGQLGEVAAIVASAVRAGRTVPQALDEAAEEIGEPVAVALNEVRSRVSVGTPFDRALESLRERPGGAEPDLFVTMLQVGRRSGASLPALLDEVAASIRDRAAADREVRALTVQARLSGRILTVLPAAFFVLTVLTSGRDLVPVLVSPAGTALVLTGVVLQTLGALWVRRIVRVEA